MNYERILVFGAHPDDEMTMAGTMAKLISQGTEVYICIMTDGCEGYPKPEWKDEIVAMRRQEQLDCDAVLGTTKRYNLDFPDMALADDKETLQRVIQVIREVRPDAMFTHGPHDKHRDHRRTCAVTVEAYFHAGQSVAAELGEPFRPRHLYYYKAVRDERPTIEIDCTGFAHVPVLVRATQVSQHIHWQRTREDFLREAEELKAANPPYSERFWLVEKTVLHDFLPRGL
ncbi:MAG: PIG-L family deacetylase [Planctomycetes bacterium]|nr:PIG-L family deacetylase [Planctomycetota bacterium]